MKTTRVAIFSMLVLISSAGVSFACSCEFKTPLEQLAESDLVVVALVVAVEEHPQENGAIVVRARVEVADVWKGTQNPLLVVETTVFGSCDLSLVPGTKYLIYGLSANGSEDLFTTHECMRTRTADEAAADIQQLGDPLYTLTPVEQATWGAIKSIFR